MVFGSDGLRRSRAVVQDRAVGKPLESMSEEYLTIEVAARLKIKPKTIRNKMTSGIFRKGSRFFSPPGMGPRFKWSAVGAWLETGREPIEHRDADLPTLRLMGKF